MQTIVAIDLAAAGGATLELRQAYVGALEALPEVDTIDTGAGFGYFEILAIFDGAPAEVEPKVRSALAPLPFPDGSSLRIRDDSDD